MNFDDIRKNIDKIIAEKLKFNEDELFGQLRQSQQQQGEEFERLFGFRPFSQQQGPPRYGFSGFRDGQGRMNIPDDGKTITLTKDDYREVEQCQHQSQMRSIGDGTDE